MNTADIIQALGGPAAIERLTGIPLTTVDSWKRKGRIPSWRISTLADLAKREGKVEAAAALERISSSPAEAA